MAQRLVGYFFRGLLVLAPIAATVYVLWLVFATVDGWINVEALLDRRLPGAGVVVTIVLVTAVGFLASNFATRWLFHAMDRLLGRLPLVKLLYTSVKDFIEAFVGDQRKFDRPVVFDPSDGSDVLLLGFLTQDGVDDLGLDGHAAVYVPQAYNFGGVVLMVPRNRIRPVAVDGTAAMTFAMSGGVSGLPGAPAESRP